MLSNGTLPSQCCKGAWRYAEVQRKSQVRDSFPAPKSCGESKLRSRQSIGALGLPDGVRRLLAISLGLSQNFTNDHEQLKHGMVIYDALYSWLKHVRHGKN